MGFPGSIGDKKYNDSEIRRNNFTEVELSTAVM